MVGVEDSSLQLDSRSDEWTLATETESFVCQVHPIWTDCTRFFTMFHWCFHLSTARFVPEIFALLCRRRTLEISRSRFHFMEKKTQSSRLFSTWQNSVEVRSVTAVCQWRQFAEGDAHKSINLLNHSYAKTQQILREYWGLFAP